MSAAPDKAFCPFTGSEIKLACVGETKNWIGFGPFYTTRLYPTRRALLHALYHRPGKAPDFSISEVESVRELVPPPPSTVADQLAADEAVEEKAREQIEKIVREPVTVVTSPGLEPVVTTRQQRRKKPAGVKT